MFNNNNKILFAKMLDVINVKSTKELIQKYNSDYRTQHFDTMSHINAMLYIQFSGTKSMHEAIDKMKNSSKLQRLINVPSISQMSRKNASRNCELFEDLYYKVLKVAQKRLGYETYSKYFNKIKIIDSSIVQLASKLAPKLEYANKKSGIRISTLFDLNQLLPEKVIITSAKIGERKCITDFIEITESLYLFDRGYYDFNWYDDLTERNYKFITRQLSYTKVNIVQKFDTGKAEIKDCEIEIGSKKRKNPKTYRQISFTNEENEQIVLLTNVFDIPLECIIELYKLRWKIELFFKWLKQHLRIKEWLGYNENAMKIQIYSALISYILLVLMVLELNHKEGILIISRIVAINLLEEVKSINIFSG